VLFFSLFAVFAGPAYLISTLFSASSATGVIQVLIFVLAAFAAWLIQLAVFEPFALAYTMVTYHREIVGKVPDPTWDNRLQGVSKSFKDLVDKATGFISKKTGPASPHNTDYLTPATAP